MHHSARILTALAVALPATVLACFTSERAEILGKQHPDIAFEDLAHHMHLQARIDYTYDGPERCTDGQVDEFSCSGVNLAGWLPLPDLGGGSGADNWGWVDPASDRMFAIMGRSNGVSFVEVTDPQNPRYLGNLPRPDGVGTSVWSDVKTHAGYAFIVADSVTGHGIQVFDLKRLLEVDPAKPQTFEQDAHYTGFDRAHNIAINSETGFAYAVGSEQCAGGLHMVDISDPLDPRLAGCYDGDGYTHDVQCVLYHGPDEGYQGREICFASNEDSVTVVDVTDKSAPVEVGRHTYDHAYTHQGWLTGDHRYFLTDDELDETSQGLAGTRTLIFDLTSLEDAPPPAEYIAEGLSIDHNQYVIGNYVFQANYKRGLRVLRIDDPATADLTEVAFFDTHPEEDGNGFSGAWSVFPYFGNDTVLVSDINRGMFILRLTDPGVARALRGALFKDRFNPARLGPAAGSR
ncbi:MAG: choice-of-anchor B family protein [Gammaproteobacteria bacterium]|jgi:choice-of-anchor B domain-containing protein|nr:choice-of-anchor B family protein [Gammaproteobacteria bacterium]